MRSQFLLGIPSGAPPGAERFATFTRYQEGREAMTLLPLWRVEVVSLDDSYIVLGGAQRTSEKGPLQYRERRCKIIRSAKVSVISLCGTS